MQESEIYSNITFDPALVKYLTYQHFLKNTINILFNIEKHDGKKLVQT